MKIVYIDIEALRKEPCLNTEHTEYNEHHYKLLVAKSKSGRVFYNADGSKSFSILHTTITIDPILELYSPLVIQWTPQELFGVKTYEDGIHTGYTVRHPDYPKYKAIWDDIPRRIDEDGNPVEVRLLPHGQKSLGNLLSELNLNLNP